MNNRTFKTLDMAITEAVMDQNMDGACTAISCCHKVGSTDDEVYGIKLGNGTFDSKSLAEVFYSKASGAVQDSGSTEIFFLYFFYAGRQQHQARHRFVIESTMQLSHGQSEPPTKEGALSQAMRQNEVMFTMNMRTMTEQLRMLLESNQATSRDLFDTRQENRELIGVFKEMMVKEAAGNHTYRMTEIAEERKAKDREFLYRVVPAAVNQLVGKEIVPQALADEGMIDALIEACDEETVHLLQKKLPAPVYAIVAARAADHWKKKKEASELAAKALQGRRDPISDDDDSKAAE